MKIYSMTATFGKLNHETLTLIPGLNLIEAPNEWGKSTWCAFLINMLYGIDTRERASGGNLPDKTHYAPWSGAPMSGRIELNWNGRDITIERSSQGRVPFGNFRAYETETGLDIPELNGTNCGKMLLGVERSVFTRAGFIRHTDMPVSADDALRRRLNDLVTTGDESGDGDRLGSTLKDLKNKCRFNNSGLLPQAETEREQLRSQLDQILDLQNLQDRLQQKQGQLTQQIDALTNHEATLRYNAAKEDAARVEQARASLKQSQSQVEQLQVQLSELPDPAQAQPALDTGNRLKQELSELEMEKRHLPTMPAAPIVPAHFAGMDPQQALGVTQVHVARNNELQQKIKSSNTVMLVLCVILGIGVLATLAGLILSLLVAIYAGFLVASVALVGIIAALLSSKKLHKEHSALQAAHPGLQPEQWLLDAQGYASRHNGYVQLLTEYNRRLEDLSRRQQLLQKQIETFTGEGTLEQRLQQWNDALSCKKQLDEATNRKETLEQHLQALVAMARPVDPPACPDQLTQTMAETTQELAAARMELQQVQQQLHQCRGRAEAMGQEAVLRSRLDATLRRISRLEDTYHALELAQEALYQATHTLQQRFAPRISKRAQELFSLLTGGRYDRLTLSEDFSLNVSARSGHLYIFRSLFV